ncbi:hypothetical protein [Streptomyces sp. NBC_00525]|uniref:hypothetical protein n=1 Tax=Streptomyces sp. NBC_00525 TaxID=2903660 RepID=UPI002E8159C8|nr:hypothetical protein [Streptomyces sp. NBC_00525]WUC97929.1 hypothetical protein OG710_30100 [Streptomyces sp. NBC_00525]
MSDERADRAPGLAGRGNDFVDQLQQREGTQVGGFVACRRRRQQVDENPLQFPMGSRVLIDQVVQTPLQDHGHLVLDAPALLGRDGKNHFAGFVEFFGDFTGFLRPPPEKELRHAVPQLWPRLRGQRAHNGSGRRRE